MKNPCSREVCVYLISVDHLGLSYLYSTDLNERGVPARAAFHSEQPTLNIAHTTIQPTSDATACGEAADELATVSASKSSLDPRGVPAPSGFCGHSPTKNTTQPPLDAQLTSGSQAL
jgi:hypothetical protein